MFENSKKLPSEESQKDLNESAERKNPIINIEESDHEKTLSRSARQQDIETAKKAADDKNQKKLEDLYQGFFGSKENCELLAQYIPEELYSLESPTIVDAGSSQGILGNYVREEFAKRGSKPRLVMIDTNSVAMKQSQVQAEKIVGNLTESPLISESADLVILRSVLQYVAMEEQIKILEEINRILKPGGVLLSQFCSYATQKQAEYFNELFISAKRKVAFCGKEEGIKMHQQIFDVITEAEGPTLHETFDEFFKQRINAPNSQIEEAEKYISEHTEELDGVLTSKEKPYSWEIPYTIAICKKRQNNN